MTAANGLKTLTQSCVTKVSLALSTHLLISNPFDQKPTYNIPATAGGVFIAPWVPSYVNAGPEQANPGLRDWRIKSHLLSMHISTSPPFG
jgi:hypothetical protein